LLLPPIRIETGEVEKIKGGRLLEKARLVAWNAAETLPAPAATDNLAHRRPVQFHAFLEILDYYVCHYRSPLVSRGLGSRLVCQHTGRMRNDKKV
jgi:hypothetical protein